MKQLGYLLFVGSLLLLNACAATKANGNDEKVVKKSLEGTYWKLTELNGEPVIAEANNRELYLKLDGSSKKLAGHGGCNGFGGVYELNSNGFNIKFTQLIRTLMACKTQDRMDQENAFLNVIEMTDSYYLNGNQLLLNRGKMAPLAKFTAQNPRHTVVLQ